MSDRDHFSSYQMAMSQVYGANAKSRLTYSSTEFYAID